MARSTKFELIEREKEIIKYLEAGRPLNDICREMAEKWKVSEHTIKKQYYKIMDDLKEKNGEKKEDLRQTLMLRNDLIYRKAMSKDRLKIALDANSAQGKLSGLYNPEKEDGNKMPQFLETEEADFSGLKVVDGDKKAEES